MTRTTPFFNVYTICTMLTYGESAYNRDTMSLTHLSVENRMPKITLTIYACFRCGHQWLSRQKKDPKYCASCRSPYWDSPRRRYPTSDPQDDEG